MTQSQKVLAILNPSAAGGKAGRQWPVISRALQQRLGAIETQFTEWPGHATALARRGLEDGHTLILAIGGDGTVNEVANGFFDDDQPINEEARLGFIPLGTGSDLQRTLGIPSQIDQAVDVIAAGESLAIDVGKVELMGHDGTSVRRCFVNMVSFGMGGDVAVEAKSFPRMLAGKTAFLCATLLVFLRYRGKRVRLTLNGARQPEEFFITNIAVGNGRYHGGGMHPCPQAVMDDGLLDVTTIDRLGMLELIRDLRMLYSGDIYQHRKVRHFRASHILAESDQPTRVEVDGEALGTLPLEIRLLPKALRMIVPPQSSLLGAGEDRSTSTAGVS